jgi:hypothetical protein
VHNTIGFGKEITDYHTTNTLHAISKRLETHHIDQYSRHPLFCQLHFVNCPDKVDGQFPPAMVATLQRLPPADCFLPTFIELNSPTMINHLARRLVNCPLSIVNSEARNTTYLRSTADCRLLTADLYSHRIFAP